jgi:cytochrome c-type biogenesis protein CcmF
LLPWKRGDLGRVMARLWWAAAVALALGGILWGWQTGDALLAPVGLALAAWLILGVVVEIGARAGLPGASLSVAFGRLARLPRADWGKFLAHGGMGLTVTGIAAVTAWQIEDIRLARPGDVIPVAGYEIRFDGVKPGQGPNYTYDRGHFTVSRGGKFVSLMTPEKRFYPVQGTPTTEAAIDSGLTRDLYLVLGDKQAGGDAWAVRTYLKPMAVWIWLGALVMALGGLVSLTDRRYRVGAAARRAPAAVAGE